MNAEQWKITGNVKGVEVLACLTERERESAMEGGGRRAWVGVGI